MAEEKSVIRRMIEHASQGARVSFALSDIELNNSHDPSDPFAVIVVTEKMPPRDKWTFFSGNSVRSSYDQDWFDEAGNLIDVKRPLTRKWSAEVAKNLAKDIQAQGRNATAGDYKVSQKIKDDEIQILVPSAQIQGNYVYTGNIDCHYLIIRTIIRSTNGKRVMRTFRTESYGRKDIAARIVEHIDRLEASMPIDEDEADRIGREKVEAAFRESFTAHGIEPDIIDIKRNDKTHGQYQSYDITHYLYDTLLKKRKETDVLSFRGNDPDNPWEVTHSHYGAGKNENRLSAEANRCAHIEKNGGLIQTSIAKMITEVAKMKTPPVMTDHNGNTKSRHFHIGTSQTKGKIFARNCRIEAEVRVGDDMKITTGTFEMKNITVPEALLNSIKGKPLRQLVEHPFISDDIIVVSARMIGNTFKAKIRMANYPVIIEEGSKHG